MCLMFLYLVAELRVKFGADIDLIASHSDAPHSIAAAIFMESLYGSVLSHLDS
jgi:hypothetical protein